MFLVTINGIKHQFSQELRIIDALRITGLKIPSICDDERLKPTGACRLCIVEVQGIAQPLTSCNNKIREGMIINSHSPAIEKLRRTLLEMLSRDYPKDDVLQETHHDFHCILNEYGVVALGKKSTTIDRSNPYIQVDMSRCIYCFRCVRICEELQGQFVWQVWNRGAKIKIAPDSLGNLGDSSCTSCGACADTCPSGAIQDKSEAELGPPDTWTRTTCAYCGVGCELMVGTKNEQIQTIRPALDAPVNKGHLCSKGRYAFNYVHSSDRIYKPLIRENGTWQELSYDNALNYVAKKLLKIKEQYGPDSIGVLGSSRATNEENYLTQKFARVVLETNNVDCCARVCHTPSAAALKKMLGSGAATNSLDDIEKAQTIMVCGTNTTENHPITGARVKQAVLNGANLIVIDPRKIELAEYATVHLPLRPGTDIALLNAMACVIVNEGLYDENFINNRVDDWEDFKSFIRAFTVEMASKICGLNPQDIRRAARLYAKATPSMILNGLGVTEFKQGTKTVMSIINLALITGNLGRQGAGVNPMRGQNNVQGAAHMGCVPNALTGGVSIKEGKRHFEGIWQAPIPSSKGLNLLKMMDAANSEKLKALYIIGYDVLLSNPNTNQSRLSFKNLELVIVQDMFMTKTAEEFGHVFLPICSSFEKEGTFMNGERRIQMVRKALEPLHKTKSDWELIVELASGMGKKELFDYHSAEEIWDEIREVWPEAGGISYARLEQTGIQWPCPDVEHEGCKILHVETFASGKKASLQMVDYFPSPEKTDENFPFLLITGRNLYQFNAGTMSGRTLNATLRPSDTLDINPEDAAKLQINHPQTIRIVSRYGEATLPIRISANVKPGELFCTFSTSDFMVNQLTSPFRDDIVDTPEYKITAVRIEPLSN